MLTSFSISVTYPGPYSCLVAGGSDNLFWKYKIMTWEFCWSVQNSCLWRYDDEETEKWCENLAYAIEDRNFKNYIKRNISLKKVTGEITCENWHSKVSHFHDGNHGTQQKCSSKHTTRWCGGRLPYICLGFARIKGFLGLACICNILGCIRLLFPEYFRFVLHVSYKHFNTLSAVTLTGVILCLCSAVWKS